MPPPSLKRIREAVDTAQQWLDAGGVKYLAAVKDPTLPIDFVIYEPFSCGVEIMDLSAPRAASMKNKRLLTRRIQLVQDFGPELPLVVVATGDVTDFPAARLLADAAYSLKCLPPVTDLRHARIAPEVAKILAAGAPRSVEFSEPEEIEERWQLSLAKNQIIEKDFPPGTIAHRMHALAQHLLQQPSTDQPTVVSTSGPKRSWYPPQSQGGVSEVSPEEMLLRSRQFNEGLGTLIAEEAVSQVGGTVQQKRVVLKSHGSQLVTLLLPLWRLGNGREIVLRRLTSGGPTVGHKAIELNAEAWMVRSSQSLASPDLFLLLTDAQRERDAETLAGTRTVPICREILRSINSFEAAGWRVFPWDFAVTKPEFLEYAQTLAEREP